MDTMYGVFSIVDNMLSVQREQQQQHLIANRLPLSEGNSDFSHRTVNIIHDFI